MWNSLMWNRLTTRPWWPVLLSALAACAEQPLLERRFEGPTMGSSYEVKYYGDIQVARAHAVVREELAAFDLAFSNWRDDSEIAAVNRHASTEPLAVSERFAGVLQQALAVAAATDGAFDPTIKPMSDVFRAARQSAAGDLDAVAMTAARTRVGFALVALEGRQLRKVRPDVQLDLDGIVAGAAADAIGQRLADLGIESFYLQVTGEVLCRGVKPGGEPYRIGVVDPSSDVVGGQTAVRTLALRDRALCSSGDYRNAVVVDGRVVHHVFDPRTGENPRHAVVSASVIATSCAIADALGTALMVLGDEETRRLWPRLQELGAEGALLLEPIRDRPDTYPNWRQVEITWPAEDS